MATQLKDKLKGWFKRGAYPSAEQFADWLDSYWHKLEGIAISAVEGLADRLNAKYDHWY